MRLLLLVFALACTPEAVDTSTTTTTGTTEPTGPDSNRFQAEGRINRDFESVDCTFTSNDYGAHIQDVYDLHCNGGYTMACEQYSYLSVPQSPFRVQVFLFPDAEVGEVDYSGTGRGVEMADEVSGATLNSTSTNIVRNHVQVTDLVPGEWIRGTFDAEWDDQGGHYGEVEGSFRVRCRD